MTRAVLAAGVFLILAGASLAACQNNASGPSAPQSAATNNASGATNAPGPAQMSNGT